MAGRIVPAPSQVLDATLHLLHVQTRFGDPLSHHWPWPAPTAEKEGAAAYKAGRPATDNPYSAASSDFETRLRNAEWAGGYRKASEQRWYTSPLLRAVLVSLSRLLIGFVAAILLGGILGLLMWRFALLDKLFGPLFLGMQTLPSVCWVPLAVLLLGINELGILFVLVMGSFFAVAIALRDGLRVIPPLYQQAGLMMGARGWKLYRYVLLPASLPALTTSLRQGFSFAWRSLMGAELILIVTYHGLGYQLHTAREVSNDVAEVVAVMIMMVIIGMAADRWVFARLQQTIFARFGLAR